MKYLLIVAVGAVEGVAVYASTNDTLTSLCLAVTAGSLAGIVWIIAKETD